MNSRSHGKQASEEVPRSTKNNVYYYKPGRVPEAKATLPDNQASLHGQGRSEEKQMRDARGWNFLTIAFVAASVVAVVLYYGFGVGAK